MLNILYMGSSKEVLSPLEELLKYPDRYKLVGVVTQGSRRVGRGQKVKESELYQFCTQKGIECFTPERASELEFIEQLKSLSIDVIVTASYGQILSDEFLSIPSISVINIHPSLLPKYRGATPIQSALLNGDKITGVSILYTVKALDAGDIIEQKEFSIEDSETALDLQDRLFKESSRLLISALSKIQDPSFKGTSQDESRKTVCKKIKKEDALIDWNDSSVNIYNKYRAFYPWPGCFSFFRKKRVNFIKFTIAENFSFTQDMSAGQFNFDKATKKLYVKTGDGFLVVERLKSEGSKEISGLDFWNGIKERVDLVFSSKIPE